MPPAPGVLITLEDGAVVVDMLQERGWKRVRVPAGDGWTMGASELGYEVLFHVRPRIGADGWEPYFSHAQRSPTVVDCVRYQARRLVGRRPLRRLGRALPARFRWVG